jgi:MFS family permease
MKNTVEKPREGVFSKGLLPLFVLAHFGHHLLTALPVPLLPMIRSDFGLDYTQSGLVVSAFNIAYGIGQLPAGWLADRFGSRLLIMVGICGVAVAGFFVGITQTFLLMIFFMALMGILGGGYHPAAPPLIFASVEPGKQGRALGVHAVGGGASFFLAPLIAVGIASFWGWRGAFIGLAVPTILFGLFFYWVLGRRAIAASPKVKAGTPAQAEVSPPGRVRRLVVFIVLATFTGAVMLSVVAFIPLYLVDHFHFGKEKAGALFAVIYFAGLWMSPLGGYLSDRLGRVPVVLVACLIAGPVVYLLNWVSSEWGVILLLLLFGMIIYTRMPASEAFVISQTSERNRSAVLGIYFFSAMEGGGLLTPVMGYCIDRLGFYYSFTIAGAAIVIVTLICAVLLNGWVKEETG